MSETDRYAQPGVAALFSAPLEEFIDRRKALVSESGDEREFARWAARLVKPTVPAWAVNRLRNERREEFDRLIASGHGLRRALSEGDPNDAMAERRAAQEAAMAAVDTLFASEGRELTPSQRREVAGTLEALSVGSDGGADREIAAGLAGALSRPLAPPGLDVLSGLSVGAAAAPVAARPKGRTAGSAKKIPGADRAGSSLPEKAARAAAAKVKRKRTHKAKRVAALDAAIELARSEVLDLQDQLEQARRRRADLREQRTAAQSELEALEREIRELRGS